MLQQKLQKILQRLLLLPSLMLTTIEQHIFAPTPVTKETGERSPAGNEKIIMVDAALFAIREIMEDIS